MDGLKKLTLILLASAILLPSGVTFAHVFANHDHHVCSNHGNDGHYHNPDLDCKYFQFRHQLNFFSTPETYITLEPQVVQETPELFCSLFTINTHLPYSLRAPPINTLI